MITVGTSNQINRETWLETTLKQISSGSRILDAGAGEQQYKKFCSHLNYISQDFAKYNGNGNKIGLHPGKWDQNNLDIISDIEKIPQPDSSFNAIMCIEVFEHLKNPIKTLQEFSRLLTPGGHLLITAPFCCLSHFTPYFFYSGFSKHFFEEYLNLNNFEIVELKENGNFFEFLGQETQRLPFVINNYAKSQTNFLERIVIKIFLSILEKYSKKDLGSKEILHFGLHIHAIKKL